MRFHSPLLRLLFCGATLWNLWVSLVVAYFLPRILGPLPLVLRGDLDAAREFEPSALSLQFSLAFLGGGVLGFVASFAWQDLTHCRMSWMLPRLRGKMRRDFLLLASLGALGAALASPEWMPGLGPLVSAGFAFAGYGWGNHLWDPHSSRLASHMAWASGLVAVRFSEALAELFVAQPWLLVVGPGACLASVLRTTGQAATRRRTLVPKHALGVSFEDYETRSSCGATNRPAGRPRARWRWGHIAPTGSWVQALRYEDTGSAGLAWFLRRGLLVAAAQVACYLGGLVELAVPIGALLIVLFERMDLRRGVSYPISRRRRARVVWDVARQQVLYLLALSLGLYLLVLVLQALIQGGSVDLSPFVHFAAMALLVSGCLPLLQAVRLHLLESHDGPVTTLRFGTTILLASMLFCGGAIWSDFQLRELEVFLRFAAALPVLIVVPLLFRGHLQRWYRLADLT